MCVLKLSNYGLPIVVLALFSMPGPRGAFGDECKLAFSAISLQLAVFPAQGADEDDRRYEIAQHR
jgi:hypothetical protein